MSALILVADDDAATRILLKSNLERQGHMVTTVEDGTQAVLKAQEIKPDLVILDIQMPGAYGPSLYESLRQNTATARIPVLFVSAHAAGEELVQQRVGLGPLVRYLGKPFDLAVLDKLVLELLDRPAAA